MAYVVVTSTTNSIKVDFGVYSGATVTSGTIPKKRGFQKREVNFTLIPDESMVEAVTVYNQLTFPVSYDGSGDTFKIDSIDGVAPTSNSDLFDKLMAMIA